MIIGPSGSGKTMLLETIAGMWNVDSGRIYMNGRDVTNLPPEERELDSFTRTTCFSPTKLCLRT